MYPPPISEVTRTIKHAVGQEVLVSAWWANGKIVRCRIGRVSDPAPFPDWKEPYYDVFPQEGNPHVRWVKQSDIKGATNVHFDCIQARTQ